MKYVFGALAAFVIIVVAVVLIFSRSPSQNNNPKTKNQQINLVDYIDTKAQVIYTVDGEINGDEAHRKVRIIIDRNQRTYQLIKGYNDQVISEKSFPNSQSAYEAFIYALKNAGFTTSQKARYDSEKGVCPLRTRMTYEVRDGDDELSRLWASKCSAKEGNFGGNDSLVRRLFGAQIPEFKELTRNTDLF